MFDPGSFDTDLHYNRYPSHSLESRDHPAKDSRFRGNELFVWDLAESGLVFCSDWRVLLHYLACG